MDDSERPGPAAGWYRDPTGQGDARYWTGSEWSDAVSRNGATTSIPIGFDLRTTPPVPGTEYVAPAAAPPVMVVRQPVESTRSERPRSPFAPLLGALLLAAAVVALIVVLVNTGDDDPADPAPTEPTPTEPAPTEPAPEQPGETTPADGSG